jgi:hypothetical protein
LEPLNAPVAEPVTLTAIPTKLTDPARPLVATALTPFPTDKLPRATKLIAGPWGKLPLLVTEPLTLILSVEARIRLVAPFPVTDTALIPAVNAIGARNEEFGELTDNDDKVKSDDSRIAPAANPQTAPLLLTTFGAALVEKTNCKSSLAATPEPSNIPFA